MVIRIHGLGDVGLHRLAFIRAFVYSHTDIRHQSEGDFLFLQGLHDSLFVFFSVFTPVEMRRSFNVRVRSPSVFSSFSFPLGRHKETEPIEPWEPHPREKMKKKGLTRKCKPPIDKASPGQEGSQERPHKVVVKERSQSPGTYDGDGVMAHYTLDDVQ